jgi:hypothetical protein
MRLLPTSALDTNRPYGFTVIQSLRLRQEFGVREIGVVRAIV